MWLQVINKVKVTHQGQGHIKVKVKYLHPFKFYVAHVLYKRVVCIFLKCYLLTVCRSLLARGVSAAGGCLLGGGGGIPTCTEADPPVNRITDTSKIITLATTSFRPVIRETQTQTMVVAFTIRTVIFNSSFRISVEINMKWLCCGIFYVLKFPS